MRIGLHEIKEIGAQDSCGDCRATSNGARVELGELLGPRLLIAGPIVDYIKVYNNIPLEAYNGLVAEADRLRMPVVGHVPFAAGIDGVLAAHQKSIEHLRGYVEKLVPAGAPVQPGIALRSRTLAAVSGKPSGTNSGALLFALVFVGVLHAAGIYVFVGIAGKTLAKQDISG